MTHSTASFARALVNQGAAFPTLTVVEREPVDLVANASDIEGIELVPVGIRKPVIDAIRRGNDELKALVWALSYNRGLGRRVDAIKSYLFFIQRVNAQGFNATLADLGWQADDVDFSDAYIRTELSKQGLFSIDQKVKRAAIEQARADEAEIARAYRYIYTDRQATYDAIQIALINEFPEGIWPRSTSRYTIRRNALDRQVVAYVDQARKFVHNNTLQPLWDAIKAQPIVRIAA